METDNKAQKMHPLLATAAVALIAVCLTGVAAMTGLLPNFNKGAPTAAATAPAVEAAAVAPAVPPTPAPAAVAPTPPVVAQAPEPAPAPKPKPKKPAAKPANVAQSDQYYRDNRYNPPPSCPNCGVVESVQAIQQQAPSSGVGAGVGAVLGGVLGNQIGNGNGRTLATVAGALGGGLAGNAVEQNRNVTVSYQVIVRMEDGNRQRFIMNEQRWRIGDAVRVDNGYLSPR